MRLPKPPKLNPILIVQFSIILIAGVLFYNYYSQTKIVIQNINQEKDSFSKKLQIKEKELKDVKSEDQYVKNKKLEKEISDIVKTYKLSVGTYENILKLKEESKKSYPAFDKTFAESISLLSQRNYSSAGAKLSYIESEIKKETAKLAQGYAEPKNAIASNNPPSSGYQRQSVKTEIGNFVVDIVSADLNSTRVIVDTASDEDCRDNCPVLSLGDYVSRNGAFAGVNGSYFCPQAYPSCAGKANSFDTLLMNKNKKYFNSDNNVYSTVPAVIFGSGWIRFVGRSLDWGRDTGIDSMIANQPLVLSGGNVAFGGDGDPKKGSKGSRSFVGNKGNTVYIGVAHNVTVAEVGYALKALGLENGLNLDSGGSTALWSGGYKAGPGRNIPNAILFVRK